MIEALHAIIEELFIVQKYDYIHCGYFEFNTPSKILQEKLGFTYYGFHTTKNGEVKIIDNLLFKENEHCIEL